MKLATTTGDFTSFQKRLDVYSGVGESLVLLKECGFKYIDLNFCGTTDKDGPIATDGWREWAMDLKKTAERLGLVFVQAHSTDTIAEKGEKRDLLTEYIRREIEVCHILGIPGMVVHGLFIKDSSRDDFIKLNVEFYSDLLETARKFDVCIYTENTCKKNCPCYYIFDAGDFHLLDAALGKPDHFGMCLDVGHAHIEGVDIYDMIQELGDRLLAVHIHDNTGADYHMQPFSGKLNFDAVVKGLVDAKFKGYFTLEALSIPTPASLLGRRKLEKNGIVYNKLNDLPMEFKLRSERLMHDIAVYMLKAYDCYEE